jgi:N-acetylglucosamine kinase-like BadF-type ATPase
MTRYFLGVDTGATKSHALVADESGHAIGLGLGGPGNWETVGWEGTSATLDDIVHRATAAAGIRRSQISAAGFGLAGYDWPEDRPPHIEIIRSLGLNIPFEVANDAFIGLLAGSTTGWGIAVSAGTSCNCYGRDSRGTMGRVGGSSDWFGEYAGAGELVDVAIHSVAKAWSCRGPETRLAERLVAAAGALDVSDLLAGLMRGRYHLSSSQAPLIFETAADGDEVARKLVIWAGRELGRLAIGVIRQLSLQEYPFEVVLSGSFFNGSPLLQQSMQQEIDAVARQAKLVRLEAPPVVGGVILGMEQLKLTGTELRSNLVETTNALMGDLGGDPA